MPTTEMETLWPSLPYEAWKDTLETLHMWMQVVGKVKLALCPFLNQWWEVTFYVTASGMTTGRIPFGNEIFEVDFDFIDHNLFIRTSSQQLKTISLMPRSVAAFHQEFMDALNTLGITVTFNPVPSEVPDPIPFPQDTKHASYDREYVFRWWRLLVQLCPIFDRFRTPFRGKSSPVHFFWGSFDLNATRFSGQLAQPPESGGRFMRFAENEQNFACGFWAGDSRYPHPAFYSYIYPAPKGIETLRLSPNVASYQAKLNEFVLPYDEVRKASSPSDMIMDFLQSTYMESAKLAGWDVQSLEGAVPS